jgi:acetyl esterase/lipase
VSTPLDQVIQLLAAMPRPEGRTFQEARADLDALAGGAVLPDDVRFEPVDAGGVPAAWIAAAGARPTRVVLYLHGGGYVRGSVTTHRRLVASLSAASGATALALDYRLAPEHPFPAAVEDAVAAYRWLVGRGVSPAALAVAGDSAGGGLTVATLVALRDGGVPLPAAAVAISPWSDLACAGDTMTTCAALDPMVQRKDLLAMAAAYLGGADPKTPLASPLHADLRGLPSLLVQVGTRETLLDDAERLVAAAQAAGVDATLARWPGMIHVWHAFAPLLPEADAAIVEAGRFLAERLSG